MAATEWTCDIDVSSPVLTPPSRLSTERMVFSTSTDHNALPVNTSDIEPATKRSRLTLTDELARANGVSEPYQKPVSDSAAARLGLSDRFKISFCARFKSALREKLESYFSRLDKAEESANTIQKELTELSGRMDAIDTSSQELKKFVTERVSLPAPTSVGHRRTLSSQAPRLPPPPPLVSALDAAPGTPTTVPFVPSRLMPVLNRPNATVNSTAGQNICNAAQRSVLTNSSLLTNSISAPSLGTAHVNGQTSKSQNPLKPPFGALGTMPSTASASRLSDTIDLTGEPPTISNVNLGRINNGIVEPSSGVVSVPTALGGAPNATASHSGLPNIRPTHSALAQAVISSKPAPALPRSPQVSNHVTNPKPAIPRQLPPPKPRPASSVLTSKPFPVAPLPPVPPSPCYAGRPSTQSAPLLTIAEAAEGICLQWTIAQQTPLYEPAAAYEIYSYASSELTASNLHTHLPWKKVGEVAALPLPMACTLTHVQPNNLYYFAVRSVDRYCRYSLWSNIVNAVVS
ncbi:Activating transcription factor 7-interacting protein 2 [Fasciola gigantica]|uniref:Activating transcription factor 7-interacting protein 2 n=1 Tax=Fasciola gigantica TaxID=46835 RepID=A0A504YEN8_FASGI|nr:Activating transcription factor 7-interacting protein 2 [Fasciola gigantica]